MLRPQRKQEMVYLMLQRTLRLRLHCMKGNKPVKASATTTYWRLSSCNVLDSLEFLLRSFVLDCHGLVLELGDDV